MKYPNLFKPIKIGNTLFRNRIFSAPIGHPDVTLDGNFSDDAIAFYERKAQGGAAAVTLGEAIVDSVYGKRHAFQVSLDNQNVFHSLSRLADSVTRHGAAVSIELQHSGMQATPGIVTPGFCTASDIVYGPSDYELDGKKIREMPEEIILEIIEKFARAALFVKNCGFTMVTVHAGHGWLLNQFLAPRLNRRKDKWGGSTENRARFVVEVCNAIHRLCGDDFPVEVRISGSEVLEGGYGIDEGIRIAKALDGYADIIHVSVGGGIGLPNAHLGFSITHPCMFKEDGVNVKYAAEVKKHVKKSAAATVGALSDPAMMEEIIASGKADIVEMARGLVCDPDLPSKARDGRDDEIVRCIRCFACFSDLVKHGGCFCALNPVTNRERTFGRLLPEAKKQKVLVVGGGIGGMQAALTAAENGHEVILCEKSGRLGGRIRCEENVPFKKHLKRYIEQRERLLAKAGVEVRLNTEVTPEYAKSTEADVIIAAIGADPLIPDIPGIDGANVIGAEEAFLNPAKVKSSALILGAGLVGTELAIYLHGLGKKVHIIEKTAQFNHGSNELHGMAVESKLAEEGIEVSFSTAAVKIDAGGVWCKTPAGERYYEADTVIYAVGQKPLTEEAMALYGCAAHFYPLGDCVTPGNIGDATAQAMTIARNIGRF
jgi:2,4-dienoyl-CoA reductase-like NADH-dependent reductase (Old Yellow Enzyme family)/NADPH-dependent 2,4-dienoyl-CoA reductase/sulfur reductase-like enzyme